MPRPQAALLLIDQPDRTRPASSPTGPTSASTPRTRRPAETIAAIIRTTSGNFDLVTWLLAQAQRITAINDLDRITVEVVIDAARDAS